MFFTLLIGAMMVGSLHAVSPDHWVPFAAVARGRSWSAARTARVTFLCGFGHVSVSALLGLLALMVGLEVMKSFGSSMGSLAGILLVGFGLAYGVWGLRRAAGEKLHGHQHHHYDHVHDPSRVSAWGLFLLSCVDPCVAVVPILFAAAPLGALSAAIVVVAYEAATLATMVLLVLLARAGATRLRWHFLEHYADGAAGALIAVVGIVLLVLGL
jgi:nickel/cobalt transporter (NicO) family protein